jgi:hypothetical protein
MVFTPEQKLNTWNAAQLHAKKVKARSAAALQEFVNAANTGQLPPGVHPSSPR